jgi:hypothetical protein
MAEREASRRSVYYINDGNAWLPAGLCKGTAERLATV